MQLQWNRLKEILASTAFSDASIEIKEPFFSRLLLVLSDTKSGSADRATACRDALGCALANSLADPTLQLQSGLIEDQDLSLRGLARSLVTNSIYLKDELTDDERAVYGRHMRRHLQDAPMDISLRQRLQNNAFTSYQGLGQQAAVRTVLTSPADSTLIINLPTGSGKTLIIHALALFARAEKLILVVVPTVGLALEQGARASDVLNQAGLCHGGAYALHGGQSEVESERVLERIRSGQQRILFCSPESVLGKLRPTLFRLAEQEQLEAMVVDEAHMIDQWGAEFRPEFHLLAPIFRSLKDISKRSIKTVLMSATFSDSGLKSLKKAFLLEGETAVEVHASFLRPEINFNVLKTTIEQHEQEVLNAVLRLPRPLILYTTKKQDAENWNDKLNSLGYTRIGLFHGGTTANSREQLITDWNKDNLDIMIATSAFGVGMDKSGVRSVLHTSIPESIDRFYQEAGRGGRDGNASWSWLIYYPSQFKVAIGLSQDKLISTNLGLERWKTLLKTQKKHGSFFTISLSALRRGVHRQSDSNRKWNITTLQLMQRAGLIKLFFVPADPPVFLDELVGNEKQQQDKYYAEYYDRIGVQIEMDGHLTPEAWVVVDKQREHEKSLKTLEFKTLTHWLSNPKQRLCMILSDFYQQGGVAPEYSCGGCPGCRALERTAFKPTLGTTFKIVGIEPPTVPAWIPNSLILRLRYKPEDYRRTTTRALLHEWRNWMSRLLASRQIQAIRASDDVLEEILKNPALKNMPFWCSLGLQDSSGNWVELVLLMPEETSFPALGFDDPPRIIIAPTGVPDPLMPNRNWWETRPDSRELTSFVREIQ